MVLAVSSMTWPLLTGEVVTGKRDGVEAWAGVGAE